MAPRPNTSRPALRVAAVARIHRGHSYSSRAPPGPTRRRRPPRRLPAQASNEPQGPLSRAVALTSDGATTEVVGSSRSEDVEVTRIDVRYVPEKSPGYTRRLRAQAHARRADHARGAGRLIQLFERRHLVRRRLVGAARAEETFHRRNVGLPRVGSAFLPYAVRAPLLPRVASSEPPRSPGGSLRRTAPPRHHSRRRCSRGRPPASPGPQVARGLGAWRPRPEPRRSGCAGAARRRAGTRASRRPRRSEASFVVEAVCVPEYLWTSNWILAARSAASYASQAASMRHRSRRAAGGAPPSRFGLVGRRRHAIEGHRCGEVRRVRGQATQAAASAAEGCIQRSALFARDNSAGRWCRQRRRVLAPAPQVARGVRLSRSGNRGRSRQPRHASGGS